MRRQTRLTLALVALAIAACSPGNAPSETGRETTDRGFAVSLTAGRRDATGLPLGGTELRNLAAYDGRLYAGNGYWEDQPGAARAPGAQILVLDSAGASWRVEHTFDERLSTGGVRHLAISGLAGVRFGTDATGQALPHRVSLLLAGTWDLSGSSQLFSRDEAGAWSASTLPVERVTSGIQQVRALGAHRDRTTGADRVFAGNDPNGIFAGAYDDAAPGHIRWDRTPELALATVAAPRSPGLTLLRVTAFAECDGSLFASVGQQVYRRIDGTPARWVVHYTNPKPGYSETGLRGLTRIPMGNREALLAAVEGYASRVVRIDCDDGSEVEELDIQALLDRAWATRVSYVIAAYNDMTLVERGDGTNVLFGLEAFLYRGAPVPPGHSVYNGLDAGGWYVVRRSDARYELREIGSEHPVTHRPLLATRAIASSPFGDDAIYFAGFDANKQPAHDTAWVLRAPASDALR